VKETTKPLYRPELIHKFICKRDFLILIKKNNFEALCYFLYHFAILFALGACLYFSLRGEATLISISISIFIYIFYCAAFNFLGTTGAMHEFAHNTVFTSKRVNEIFFKIFGILTWTNASMFRITHFNHHRNFLFDGDIEGNLGNNERLTLLGVIGKVFFSPTFVARRIYYTVLSSGGIFVSPKLKNLIGKSKKTVQIDALSIIAFHTVLVILSFLINSYYPIMLLTAPSFVAHYLAYVLASSQHNVCVGSARTYSQLSASVSINLPIFIRALYWNMNFHSEHHLAPMVPHYNLSRLQSVLKRDQRASNLNERTLIEEIGGIYVKN